MTVSLSDPPGAAEARQRLAAYLQISDPRWREAFATVPRHHFAPEFDQHLPDGTVTHFDATNPGYLDVVYSDDALVTRVSPASTATSSSTQPSVMGVMLDALNVRDGHRVLEIGTGTGYNSALLAHRLGDVNVTSIEIDAPLVDHARGRLARLGFEPTLVAGDGLAGYSPLAPFDSIIATCSTGRVPTAWPAQTRPGGIIVANVGEGVVPLQRGQDGSASGLFLPDVAGFIEARAADTPAPMSAEERIDLMLHQPSAHTRPTELLGDMYDDEFVFVTTVVVPGLRRLWTTEDNPRWYAVADTATRSWARATAHQDETTVTRGGLRDLWTELETAWTWWDRAGRPAHDRLGLTVASIGTHTLWVDQPGRHSLTLPG